MGDRVEVRTVRDWVRDWLATGLMNNQAANALLRQEGWCLMAFDAWARSVRRGDLMKLHRMGHIGIANVAGLLRLSGYDLWDHEIERDPRGLVRPVAPEGRRDG